MKYILSVDGGGSKTEFVLYNIENQKLTIHLSGSSNFKNIGLEKTYETISSGINEILIDASATIKDLKYSVFGFSGCDTENDLEKLQKMLQRLTIESPYKIVNDGELAFRGTGTKNGAIIISGTGSVVLGFYEEAAYRIGGWGSNISDIGSGYWLGRGFLEKLLLYMEGLHPEEEAFRKFLLEGEQNLQTLLTKYETVTDISKIAKFVIENSDLKICKELLEEGIDFLCRSVIKIFRQMECEEYNLVLSGTIAKTDIFQKFFMERLIKNGFQKKVKIIKDEQSPAISGIKFGLENFGGI